jgi:hypothetical protein
MQVYINKIMSCPVIATAPPLPDKTVFPNLVEDRAARHHSSLCSTYVVNIRLMPSSRYHHGACV